MNIFGAETRENYREEHLNYGVRWVKVWDHVDEDNIPISASPEREGQRSCGEPGELEEFLKEMDVIEDQMTDSGRGVGDGSGSIFLLTYNPFV